MIRALLLAVVLGSILSACGSEAGNHSDADTHGAAVGSDGGDDAAASDTSSDGDASSADATQCAPACVAGEICCTDQHGHFPKCVLGTSCP